MNRPDTIRLSGHVVFHKWDFGDYPIGTVHLHFRDTKEGARNRRGRHTNYGYSGYFLASIYDGHKWRRLQFNKLVCYDDRSYEYARRARD